MRDWWQGLAPRERWMVTTGAAAAVILLFYALVWHPLQQELKDLRQTVAALRSELAWMQQGAAEVKQLRAAGATPQPSDATSLLTLVDRTARAAGLGTAVKRVEPQRNDQLRVNLEDAAFDTLVRWLNSLEQDHGVGIVSATVDRQDEGGRVDARLILAGGAP